MMAAVLPVVEWMVISSQPVHTRSLKIPGVVLVAAETVVLGPLLGEAEVLRKALVCFSRNNLFPYGVNFSHF